MDFKKIFLAFFIITTAAAPVEHVNAEAVKLDEIVVAAERLEAKHGDTDIIGEGTIEQPRMSRTVDGLFENAAGIDLRRTSTSGNTGSDVILRGFDESRYLVTLDGRPLNGSGVYGGEYVDWSSISTEDIERVEVIRGAKSAEYGNTLGGVINIVPKKGSDEMKMEIRSSYGSFNTIDAAVSHSGNWGKFIYDNLSYGHWRTDGFLRNNYVERNNFSGRLDFRMPWGLNLRAGARYTEQERGFVVRNREGDSNYNSTYPESDEDAGAGPFLQWWGRPGPFGRVRAAKYWGDGSYWKNKRGQYDLALEKVSGDLLITAQAYANRQERTEYYYDINNCCKLALERYSEPERTWGWLAKAYQAVGPHSIAWGLEGVYNGYGGQDIRYADSTYFRIQPASSDGSEDATRLHSVFAQGTLAASDAFDIDCGLRYDYYLVKYPEQTDKHGLSPKLGLIYKVWDGLRVEADFGQAYRFPTNPESYWYYAGYQPADRKSLTPERALQAEAGIYNEFGDKGRIGVRGYYYYVYDYIRTIFGYRPSRVVYNIGEVSFLGMEVEGEYSILKNVSVFGNYTFQTTKKKGDILDESSALTDELTELPKNKVNAGVRCGYGGLFTELVMRYVDKRQVLTGSQTNVPDASGLATLSQFATFDVNASYEFLKKDRITGKMWFSVENIFGAEYEEVNGFPMSGAVFTGGVTIGF